MRRKECIIAQKLFAGLLATAIVCFCVGCRNQDASLGGTPDDPTSMPASTGGTELIPQMTEGGMPSEPMPMWGLRCEFPETVYTDDHAFTIRIHYGTHANVFGPDVVADYYDRTIELFIEYSDEGITQEYLLRSLTREETEQEEYSIDQYTFNPDVEAFHHYDDYTLPIDQFFPDESGQIKVVIAEYLFRGQDNEEHAEARTNVIHYEKRNGMILFEVES